MDSERSLVTKVSAVSEISIEEASLVRGILRRTSLLLGLGGRGGIERADGVGCETDPLWLVTSLVVVASEETETVGLFGGGHVGHFEVGLGEVVWLNKMSRRED